MFAGGGHSRLKTFLPSQGIVVALRILQVNVTAKFTCQHVSECLGAVFLRKRGPTDLKVLLVVVFVILDGLNDLRLRRGWWAD